MDRGRGGTCFNPQAAGKGWFTGLLELIFPERCLFCRNLLSRGTDPVAGGRPLCAACAKLYKPGGRICPYCGGFSRGEPPCDCLQGSLLQASPEKPLRGLFTVSLYDQNWRRLIHDLKYRKRSAAARPLGNWLAGEIKREAFCRPEAVVPLPLHRQRELERGYNQSALLAAHTAETLHLPYLELLIKNKPTASQVALSRRQRQENVRGSFKVNTKIEPGITVLLIDDVYSTGSTMKEAASVLHASGAKVYGAVISYNPGAGLIKKPGFYDNLERW